jgi:RHS repeat-associated protein
VGYREALDWSAPVELEPDAFTGGTAFDAMDRPVAITTADGSALRPAYNEAGLLERLDAELAGVADPGQPADLLNVITNVDYNARGQRVTVERGNGLRTCHEYDPATFRLVRVLTTRQTRRGRERVQDLRHTYDPEGNPTSIVDAAQQRLFFRNRVVRPGGRYAYDALYRLVRASGREHLGQAGAVPPRPRGPKPRRLHANDGAAMGRYTERYRYDPVGNLLEVRHTVTDPAVPGWTRRYRYDEPSLLEPDRTGNRLTDTGNRPTRGHEPANTPARTGQLAVIGTSTGADASRAFGYDAQGNTTSMPDLPVLAWDPEDRLHHIARRAGGGGAQTWMSYDGTGQRVRKVTTKGHAGRRERVYLGPFERYREYRPGGEVTLERTSLHVLDTDRRVALVETRTRGADRGSRRLVRHQLEDHLGSATVELDQDARLLGYEEYHPYGSTAHEAVASRREAPKRYRYTGRERDEESGLRYHGARYYAPWLARWASPDPATTDSLSPYGYVGGSPLRLVDPSGHAGEGRQMNLAETFTQEVMATRAGRGISPALRSDLRAMWAWWGGAGPVDAGHVGTAQAFLRAGQRGLVAAQPTAENRSLGQLVRLQAAAHRLAGLFVRTAGGVDASVAAGSRFGAAARAGWRDSQNFQEWLKIYARTGDAAAPPAGAGTSAGTGLARAGALATEAAEAARQLELPFGKAAQAVAKVEQTLVSAAPAAETAAETAGTPARQASTLSRAAGTATRVARAAAPVLRVVAKVAAPVAVVASVAEAATAKTQSEKAHAAVNLTASVAALSSNPVTGIAAGGLAAGGYVSGKVEPIVTGATGSRRTGVAAGTLAGAATGAGIGAAIGTIVPGFGTAVGAGVGAAAGAIGGFVTSYWK